ncbi:MAG: 3-phosphoshikimate 1-carboxyvinyltransferase, partial [Prevotellaceae bacterium]|nr:3-phosphoshikimate 1-carboxyvinyltransferase [Prevotellaceae bacterium]
HIEYLGTEGFPPLRVTGRPLAGGALEVAGDVSSQYISALLMIGPMLRQGLTLKLTGDIVSRPYIDLTLWTMTGFGAQVEWSDVDTISVAPVPYRATTYAVENDWSAASYWYEVVALLNKPEARVVLPGLSDGSRQGDSVTRYIGSLMGVKTTFDTLADGSQQVVLASHGCTLPRLDYDFVNSPDLVQTFVVACAAKGIPFHFTGLASLKIKETDRIEALKRELRKLGVLLTDRHDSELIWDGERCDPTMEPIDTYQDHRMAMAFAPAALTLGPVTINHPEVVSKSYPHYWDDLRRAGFKITQTP